MTLRIGFVGCGFIASVHSLAIATLIDAGLVDARIVSACDADPTRAARLAASCGAQVYDEVEDVLDSCDAVWICTWTSAHLPVVRGAVARGHFVFCEKPLAPTLPDAEEVAALLGRVPHQVGLVLRHAPVFAALADAVGSGRYGRPLATVLRDDQYFPIQGMYGSDWRADPRRAGGGTLLEHSIHDVDVLGWILGAPSEVSARIASMFGHAGIDDVADVTLSYGDGSVATLVSVWHQVTRRASTRRIELFCEDAVLWSDDDHLGPLHVETAAGESVIAGEVPEWLAGIGLPEEIAVPLAPYLVAAKAGLDAAVVGKSARPDAATALTAHRIVDAAYRSAASGGGPIATPG